MKSESIWLPLCSACAPVPLVLDVDVDRVLEVPAELLGLFLEQRIPRNDCTRLGQLHISPGSDGTYPQTPALR